MDLKDDNIQILTKSLGVSLFGRQLKKSHLLTSPYIIPKVKKNVNFITFKVFLTMNQ